MSQKTTWWFHSLISNFIFFCFVFFVSPTISTYNVAAFICQTFVYFWIWQQWMTKHYFHIPFPPTFICFTYKYRNFISYNRKTIWCDFFVRSHLPLYNHSNSNVYHWYDFFFFFSIDNDDLINVIWIRPIWFERFFFIISNYYLYYTSVVCAIIIIIIDVIWIQVKANTYTN